MVHADSFLSLLASEYNAATAVWHPQATHHATTAAAAATHAVHKPAAPKVNMSTASILVISLPDGYTREESGVPITKARAKTNANILNKACKKSFHDHGVNPKCKSVNEKGNLQAFCPPEDFLCYCALKHCDLTKSQILVGYPDPTSGTGHITKHPLPKDWKSHDDDDLLTRPISDLD